MDSMQAMVRGEASRGGELKVFDWARAARLIKERKPAHAAAGLRDDWEWTGGRIYEDGEPVPQKDTYTYLASTWAMPELDLDGEIVECYVMEHETDWNSGTYWPKEALEILTAAQ